MSNVLRLHALLRDYRGPLRADMRRVYGIDLDEVVEQRSIKPSVLLDLIDHLPADAAIHRALDPMAAWSQTDYLLAVVADRVGQVLNALGAKPKYEPLPRPGDTPVAEAIGASKGFDSIDEFEAWYATKSGRTEPAG